METLDYAAWINIALLIAVLGFMWKLSRDMKSAGDCARDRLDAFRAEVQKDQKDLRDRLDAFRAEVQKDQKDVRDKIEGFRGEVRDGMGKLSGRMDVLSQQVST